MTKRNISNYEIEELLFKALGYSEEKSAELDILDTVQEVISEKGEMGFLHEYSEMLMRMIVVGTSPIDGTRFKGFGYKEKLFDGNLVSTLICKQEI